MFLVANEMEVGKVLDNIKLQDELVLQPGVTSFDLVYKQNTLVACMQKKGKHKSVYFIHMHYGNDSNTWPAYDQFGKSLFL